jgi:hypothetical protein
MLRGGGGTGRPSSATPKSSACTSSPTFSKHPPSSDRDHPVTINKSTNRNGTTSNENMNSDNISHVHDADRKQCQLLQQSPLLDLLQILGIDASQLVPDEQQSCAATTFSNCIENPTSNNSNNNRNNHNQSLPIATAIPPSTTSSHLPPHFTLLLQNKFSQTYILKPPSQRIKLLQLLIRSLKSLPSSPSAPPHAPSSSSSTSSLAPLVILGKCLWKSELEDLVFDDLAHLYRSESNNGNNSTNNNNNNVISLGLLDTDDNLFIPMVIQSLLQESWGPPLPVADTSFSSASKTTTTAESKILKRQLGVFGSSVGGGADDSVSLGFQMGYSSSGVGGLVLDSTSAAERKKIARRVIERLAWKGMGFLESLQPRKVSSSGLHDVENAKHSTKDDPDSLSRKRKYVEESQENRKGHRFHGDGDDDEDERRRNGPLYFQMYLELIQCMRRSYPAEKVKEFGFVQLGLICQFQERRQQQNQLEKLPTGAVTTATDAKPNSSSTIKQSSCVLENQEEQLIVQSLPLPENQPINLQAENLIINLLLCINPPTSTSSAANSSTSEKKQTAQINSTLATSTNDEVLDFLHQNYSTKRNYTFLYWVMYLFSTRFFIAPTVVSDLNFSNHNSRNVSDTESSKNTGTFTDSLRTRLELDITEGKRSAVLLGLCCLWLLSSSSSLSISSSTAIPTVSANSYFVKWFSYFITTLNGRQTQFLTSVVQDAIKHTSSESLLKSLLLVLMDVTSKSLGASGSNSSLTLNSVWRQLITQIKERIHELQSTSSPSKPGANKSGFSTTTGASTTFSGTGNSSRIDVGKLLSDFEKTGVIPKQFFIEILVNDSWYKKQFLPSLLSPEPNETKQTRLGFFEVLKCAGRVPKALLDKLNAGSENGGGGGAENLESMKVEMQEKLGELSWALDTFRERAVKAVCDLGDGRGVGAPEVVESKTEIDMQKGLDKLGEILSEFERYHQVCLERRDTKNANENAEEFIMMQLIMDDQGELHSRNLNLAPEFVSVWEYVMDGIHKFLRESCQYQNQQQPQYQLPQSSASSTRLLYFNAEEKLLNALFQVIQNHCPSLFLVAFIRIFHLCYHSPTALNHDLHATLARLILNMVFRGPVPWISSSSLLAMSSSQARCVTHSGGGSVSVWNAQETKVMEPYEVLIYRFLHFGTAHDHASGMSAGGFLNMKEVVRHLVWMAKAYAGAAMHTEGTEGRLDGYGYHIGALLAGTGLLSSLEMRLWDIKERELFFERPVNGDFTGSILTPPLTLPFGGTSYNCRTSSSNYAWKVHSWPSLSMKGLPPRQWTFIECSYSDVPGEEFARLSYIRMKFKQFFLGCMDVIPVLSEILGGIFDYVAIRDKDGFFKFCNAPFAHSTLTEEIPTKSSRTPHKDQRGRLFTMSGVKAICLCFREELDVLQDYAADYNLKDAVTLNGVDSNTTNQPFTTNKTTWFQNLFIAHQVIRSPSVYDVLTLLPKKLFWVGTGGLEGLNDNQRRNYAEETAKFWEEQVSGLLTIRSPFLGRFCRHIFTGAWAITWGFPTTDLTQVISPSCRFQSLIKVVLIGFLL